MTVQRAVASLEQRPHGELEEGHRAAWPGPWGPSQLPREPTQYIEWSGASGWRWEVQGGQFSHCSLSHGHLGP